jgi:hypothetical protein
LAECQERIISQYEHIHGLVVKEVFIIGQQVEIRAAKIGYDEAHELTTKVMDHKLCIANLSKLKKLLGVSVGDEAAFDKMLRSSILTTKIVT